MSTTSAATISASSTAARRESHRSATRSPRSATEIVAIHDAARPLVTAALVEEVVAALLADEDADGAIAAAPVTDTIKRAGDGTGPAFPLDSGVNARSA